MGRTAVVSGFAEFTYSDKIKEAIKKVFGGIKGLETNLHLRKACKHGLPPV